MIIQQIHVVFLQAIGLCKDTYLFIRIVRPTVGYKSFSALNRIYFEQWYQTEFSHILS